MTQRPNPVPLRPDRSATARNGANSFARSVFARVQARTLGRDVAEFIKDDPLTLAVIERAAAPLGTTTGAGWAAELARDAWAAYLTSLSPYSGAARLIAQAVQATAHGVNETFYPVRAAGAQPPGFVGEAEPIPVRGDTFSLITLGPLKKLASIVGWSKELGKRSDAENIFKLMLAEDVSAGIDAAFFSDAAADSTRPAGLLNGVTPIAGATGADAAAADLAALASAVATGGSGNVTYIVAPARLAKLRFLVPTVFPQLDIVASAALPAATIVAVDGRSLLVAVGPDPDISISSVATLHFDTEPLQLVSDAPVTANPVRDLFQTASLAARVIHEISWVTRRAGAVSFVDDASW